MSKDKDEWGNIELPGFGDDLLLSPNLNKLIANREKANDPKIVSKIKKALTGKPRSAEVVKRMSESRLGVKRGPCSAESKEKNRQSNLGKVRSAETRLKISKNKSIAMNTPEARLKNSEQAKSRLQDPTKNPNFKGNIIGTHIETNQKIECTGPKDFVPLDINYFTVLKRIKSGKPFKGYVWTRKEK